MYHFLLLAANLLAVNNLEGTVTLESTGKPLHHVTVVLPQLNKSTETDDDGKFVFVGLPEGQFDVVAQSAGLADERKKVVVTKDNKPSVSFSLRLMPIRQEITVTASGKVETTLEAINSVTALDTLDLASKTGVSVGDLLDSAPGVAKRSFGPGTTRPVLRGFDGDRVLIMQDGVRTGSLSSQSGDHGEPVDPQSLERVEIVRGPATLLYGSNAIGGVVNMITENRSTHNGYLSAMAGSNNGLFGGSAGVSAGTGAWLLRLNAGGQHTSDYNTARERIVNSGARALSGGVSLSRYGKDKWFTLAYNTQRGTYQIPQLDSEDERVQLPFTRHNIRVTGGLREKLNFSLSYSDWHHDELANGSVDNQFFNKQFDYRVTVEQKRRGPFSGSFGVWGLNRDYKAVGVEATTPPVGQRSFAAFGLESIQLERMRLQFGGRVENTRYSPGGLPERSFTGFSGSAGVNVPLWRGGAFVSSFNHSFRAPALEELYSNGPHVGNLTFEIGDVNLRGERSNGFDVALRHTSARYKGEANWFYYRLNQYVYLAPTGEIEDGLIAARYSQNNARYAGFEGRFQAALHSKVWMNLGFDMVNAELRLNNTPVPRIPPGRGRVGLEFRQGAFSIAPELVLARRQDRIFPTETETAGYATGSIRASYTLARQHALHLFSVNVFNANNAYYRNHLSFIKDAAAEIGRGVVVSYNVRFF
ncbi:MAG: TonB-dependent receptor [Acidobacteria bacterium]|nr:TonB-dependent receptor [Acidobacteriota bacterium]